MWLTIDMQMYINDLFIKCCYVKMLQLLFIYSFIQMLSIVSLNEKVEYLRRFAYWSETLLTLHGVTVFSYLWAERQKRLI